MSDPKMIDTLLVLQGLQVLFGFYIFFVSFYKGYDSIKECWLKFGPVIHLLMVIYNYFAVPITTLVFFLKSDKSAIVESRILEFSLLVYFGSLIVFFITVLPVVRGAIAFLQRRTVGLHNEVPGKCNIRIEWDEFIKCKAEITNQIKQEEQKCAQKEECQCDAHTKIRELKAELEKKSEELNKKLAGLEIICY